MTPWLFIKAALTATCMFLKKCISFKRCGEEGQDSDHQASPTDTYVVDLSLLDETKRRYIEKIEPLQQKQGKVSVTNATTSARLAQLNNRRPIQFKFKAVPLFEEKLTGIQRATSVFGVTPSDHNKKSVPPGDTVDEAYVQEPVNAAEEQFDLSSAFGPFLESAGSTRVRASTVVRQKSCEEKILPYTHVHARLSEK